MTLSLFSKADPLVSDPSNGVCVVSKYFGHVRMDLLMLA